MLIFHLYADIYATFLFLEWFDILLEILKKKNEKRDRGKKDDTHTHIFSLLASLSFVRSLPKSRDETRQDTKQMTEEKKTDGHNLVDSIFKTTSIHQT